MSATVLEWVAFTSGLLIVAATWGSVVRTLVVPRGMSSRLSAAVERSLRTALLLLSRRSDDFITKDRILALQGPLSLLALLVSWFAVFLVGYALMAWPLIDASFDDALRQSVSSMLTLGFAATPGLGLTMLYLIAAGTGLVVIALEIAYLPVLYAAFNRRETAVTMLQSRAGAPAWGPEILARHQLVHIVDNLPDFYREWERWAADVAESHANYPILTSFRSPHPLRSWAVGLLAVLDSAALYHSLSPSSAPSEARLCIRMGFTCLRDIATAIGIAFDPDPFPDDPIQLTFEEFKEGIVRLEQAGFPMERTPDEAWPHFRGWRVNYETVAYALADRLVAAPGPWSGPRQHLAGMVITPVRPADRKPHDAGASARPKGSGVGW